MDNYMIIPKGKSPILCNSAEEFRKIAIQYDFTPCTAWDFICDEPRRIDFDVWNPNNPDSWVDVKDRYGTLLCTLKPEGGKA